MLHIPSPDGGIKSTTNGIPSSSSRKFDGRHTRRMRAQHRRRRLCPDRAAAAALSLLHLPPLFAFRRCGRLLERDLIRFRNPRRPQPDQTVPARSQNILSVRARRHVRDGRVVQVQSRERRGGRLRSIERYARDLCRAIVRGGCDEQSILVLGTRLLL